LPSKLGAFFGILNVFSFSISTLSVFLAFSELVYAGFVFSYISGFFSYFSTFVGFSFFSTFRGFSYFSTFRGFSYFSTFIAFSTFSAFSIFSFFSFFKVFSSF